MAYIFPAENQAVQSEASAGNAASAADFTRTFVRKPGELVSAICIWEDQTADRLCSRSCLPGLQQYMFRGKLASACRAVASTSPS